MRIKLRNRYWWISKAKYHQWGRLWAGYPGDGWLNPNNNYTALLLGPIYIGTEQVK